MQARGPLMIEHRMIERMLSVIKTSLLEIESKHEIDPVFVDIVVDFIKVYVDLTHHGKEEDILFKELKNKSLSAEDEQLMNELIEEHMVGRQISKALGEANIRNRNGDVTSVPDIVDKLQTLTQLYPDHIEKEDKKFFPSSRAYLTEEEDQAMLAKFFEFDRKMIHKKYQSVIEGLEKR